MLCYFCVLFFKYIYLIIFYSFYASLPDNRGKYIMQKMGKGACKGIICSWSEQASASFFHTPNHKGAAYKQESCRIKHYCKKQGKAVYLIMSHRVKLSNYQSIHIPALTFGHKIRIVTERTRWLQPKRVSSVGRLVRAAAHSLYLMELFNGSDGQLARKVGEQGRALLYSRGSFVLEWVGHVAKILRVCCRAASDSTSGSHTNHTFKETTFTTESQWNWWLQFKYVKHMSRCYKILKLFWEAINQGVTNNILNPNELLRSDFLWESSCSRAAQKPTGSLFCRDDWFMWGCNSPLC